MYDNMMRYTSIGGKSSMAGGDELILDFYNSTTSRGHGSTVDAQPTINGSGEPTAMLNGVIDPVSPPQQNNNAKQKRKKVGFFNNGKPRLGNRGKRVDSKTKSDGAAIPSTSRPSSGEVHLVTDTMPVQVAAKHSTSRIEDGEKQDKYHRNERPHNSGSNVRRYNRLKGNKISSNNRKVTAARLSTDAGSSVQSHSKTEGVLVSTDSVDRAPVDAASGFGDENANHKSESEVNVSQPHSVTKDAITKQKRQLGPPPPPTPRSASSVELNKKTASSDIRSATLVTPKPDTETSTGGSSFLVGLLNTKVAPEIDTSVSIVRRADFRNQLESIISSRGSPASTATSSVADRIGNVQKPGRSVGMAQLLSVNESNDPNQSAGTIISRLFSQALENYDFDENGESSSVVNRLKAQNNSGKQFRFPVAGIDMPPVDETVDTMTSEPVIEEMDDVTRVVRIRKGFSYLSDVSQAAEVSRRAVDVTSRKPHESIFIGVPIKEDRASEDETMLQEARARLHHSEPGPPPIPPPTLPPYLAQTGSVSSTTPTKPPAFLREMLDTVRARQLKLNNSDDFNTKNSDLPFTNKISYQQQKSHDSDEVLDEVAIVLSSPLTALNARQVSHDLLTARGNHVSIVDVNEFTSIGVDTNMNADRSSSTPTDHTPPTTRRVDSGSRLHANESTSQQSSRSAPSAKGVTVARDNVALLQPSDYATPAGSGDVKASHSKTNARRDATTGVVSGKDGDDSVKRSNSWNFATVLVDVHSDSTNDQRREITDDGNPLDDVIGRRFSSKEDTLGDADGNRPQLTPPLSLGFVSSGSDYDVDSVTSPSDAGLQHLRLVTLRAARQRLQKKSAANNNRTPQTRHRGSNTLANDRIIPVSVNVTRGAGWQSGSTSRAVNVEVAADFEHPTTVGMVQIPSAVSSAQWSSNGNGTNNTSLPFDYHHSTHEIGRQQTALNTMTHSSNGRSLLTIGNHDVMRPLEKPAERAIDDVIELSAVSKQRDVRSILAPLYVYPIEADPRIPSVASYRESINPQLEDIAKFNGSYHVQMKLNTTSTGSATNGLKVGDQSYSFASPRGLSSNGVTKATWYEPTFASNDFRHISVATVAHLDEPTYSTEDGKLIRNRLTGNAIVKSSSSDHEDTTRRHRRSDQHHVAREILSDDDRRPTRFKTGSHGRRSTSATRSAANTNGKLSVWQLPASAVSFDIELQSVSDRENWLNGVNRANVDSGRLASRRASHVDGSPQLNASQPIYSLRLSETMVFDIDKGGTSSQRKSKKQRTARRRRRVGSGEADEGRLAGNIDEPTSLGLQHVPLRSIPVEVQSSDEDDIDVSPVVVKSRDVELPRIVRGSILIRNPIDSIGLPRQIDVVTDEALTPEGVVVDDNTNMFDGLYRQSRENPVYLSDDDDENLAGTRHHETHSHSALATADESIVKESYPKTTSNRRLHDDDNNHVSSKNDFNNEIPIVRNAQYTNRSKSKTFHHISEDSLTQHRQPLVDAPNGVKQTVDVRRDNEEIIGPGHDSSSPDGGSGQVTTSVNVDAVSEKVSVTLENGVARITVRVLSERVVPIRGSVDMFKKSSVIVTRLIEIDMTTSEERRRLYDRAVELQSIDSSEVGGGSRLSTRHTFELYKALSRIADQSAVNNDGESSSPRSRSTARQHMHIERVLEEKQSRRGSGFDID